jgi:broad specificity phosphatase PhoE
MDFSQDIIVMPKNVILDPDFTPENGESRNDSASRLFTAITEITKTSDYKNIGISTHGGIARAFMTKFPEFDSSIGGIPSATYFRLDWDGEKLSLNELPELGRNLHQ